MGTPQLDIQFRFPSQQGPQFDPSQPFQVEGDTSTTASPQAGPASSAPQFDPSKPFDVLQADQTATNAYNGIFSSGIPSELQSAYDAGRARAKPPTTDIPQQLAVDFQNQGSAAAQGTTPNIEAQKPNLISDKVFQNDAGELQYVDPASGQLVTTDQNKQVILRDPTD